MRTTAFGFVIAAATLVGAAGADDAGVLPRTEVKEPAVRSVQVPAPGRVIRGPQIATDKLPEIRDSLGIASFPSEQLPVFFVNDRGFVRDGASGYAATRSARMSLAECERACFEDQKCMSYNWYTDTAASLIGALPPPGPQCVLNETAGTRARFDHPLDGDPVLAHSGVKRQNIAGLICKTGPRSGFEVSFRTAAGMGVWADSGVVTSTSRYVTDTAASWSTPSDLRPGQCGVVGAASEDMAYYAKLELAETATCSLSGQCDRSAAFLPDEIAAFADASASGQYVTVVALEYPGLAQALERLRAPPTAPTQGSSGARTNDGERAPGFGRGSVFDLLGRAPDVSGAVNWAEIGSGVNAFLERTAREAEEQRREAGGPDFVGGLSAEGRACFLDGDVAACEASDPSPLSSGIRNGSRSGDYIIVRATRPK